MADKRIQQYPEKVAPSTSDYLLVADAEDVDVNGYLKYKKVKISSLDNIVITNAEDITLTAINTLISTNALVIGRFYRITNSASGVNPILVQAVALNVLSDIGISSVNGTVYNYDISTDTVSVPYAGVYVPYTGATTNVDLGEYQIKVGQLELDQTPTGTFGVGKIRWNDTDGTPEVMLKGANVTLQIGQEQLARVVNKTNTNLTEAGYQVVRISGAQGQRLKVGLAQANSTTTCKDTLGLVTENISNNAEGFITTSGLVRSINTTGSLQGETWADGDRIYLSPSVAGGITNVEPSAPNIVIVLGYVVYAHANQGSIYVSVEGAKALHELFDVSIPTPTNNNVLVYESSTGLWKDKSISTILGFTPIANNATVGGELSGTLPNPSLVTSAVTGKALTGLSVSGSAVVSTDSILTGIGKLQNQINAVVGSVNFQGVWNASTNSPSLASGVGTKGYYYVVSVPGSTNLDGITDWKLGDWAIYDGTAWQKVDNTDAVVSVNGYTGIVTLAKADIGLGNVENTALSTWAGSGNITTLGTISSGVWNGTAIGDTYISSASTWNAKIGGSGTTGRLAKFTSSGAVGDSVLKEDGENIYIDNGDKYIILDADSTGTGSLALQAGRGSAAFGGSVIMYSNAHATKAGYTEISTSAVVGAKIRFTNTAFGAGSELMSISRDGQIITNAATNTGEAHIFGGSVRVNGNVGINTTSLFSEFTIAGANVRHETGQSSATLFYSEFLNTGRSLSVDYGHYAKNTTFNTKTGGSGSYFEVLKINDSGQISTLGASIASGESFIIGGSARVNGTLRTTGNAWIYDATQDRQILIGEGSRDVNIAGATSAATNTMIGFSNVAGNNRLSLYEDKIIVTSTGNVGIGTSSPISGQGTPLTLASSTGYVGLTLSGSGAYSHLWQLYASGDGGSNKFFGIYDSTNATYRLVTTSGGNVGIGTTSPSSKLHIYSTTWNSVEPLVSFVNLDPNTADSNGLFVQAGADNAGAYIAKFVDYSGNEKFIINGAGAATFSSSVTTGADATINGVTVGRGGGNITSNTTVGVNALYSNTTGNYNTANGVQALYSNTTGVYNTANGINALFSNTTGNYNTANGVQALYSNTIGSANTANGINALFSNTTGNHNTSIGYTSLFNNTGSNNTAVGFEAGNANTTGVNNIFIGYQSTGVSITESNRTWIGNSSTTSSWLAGNVLIGTTTDDNTNKLQVNGSFKATALSTIITSNGNVLNFGLSGQPIITLYQNSTLYGYYNNTTGLTNFSINNSTGAATFSSKITAGSSTETLNAFSGSNNSLAQATIYGYNYNASGYSFYSGQGKINFQSLPTSSAGLSAGDLWNNGGVVSIV